ncbi:DNA polymerase III subunit delta [Pelagibacterales bacterium SAG-MED47]|nr:DNA polymerase III subunit delta [Pelagibacterales bacterium SAG-MED47]
MIKKSYEIKNFLGKNNIFLIYGENEGLKEDIISKITPNYTTENIFRYSEKEVYGNLENFYNSIYSQSFFNDKKLILINEVTEKFKNEIEEILERKIKDIIIILLSRTLEKKSKLRNFFEKEKNLICVPVYKDDNKTLLNIAFTFFKSKKITISNESINIIVERASEDRKNLKSELDKIENFSRSRKKIDIEDLIKLTNLSENHSINKIVDLSLSKNTKQTLRTLNENIFAPEDNIIIIRSFLTKSKRLLKLTEELEKNKNIDQVISMSKPPIFWKDKDIVRNQLTEWKKDDLIKLIKNINDVELLLKKNSQTSVNILQNFIIEQSSRINN